MPATPSGNEQRRPLRGKKLLVAAVGVGVMRLVACNGTSGPSGNLIAPPCDAGSTAPYCVGQADLATTPDLAKRD